MRKLFWMFLLCAIPLKAQDTIVFSCSEDYYTGDAQFSMTIDGKGVTSGTLCTARGGPAATPQQITFNGSWGGNAVAHKIVVLFINDAYGGSSSTDRNLYGRGLTFDGTAASPATTQPMYSNANSATYTTVAVTPPPVVTPPAAPSFTIGTISINVAVTPVGHSVSLTWSASASTVSGYNIYRSTTNGSGYAKLNAALLPGLTYVDSSVASGVTYYYVATAVNSNGESPYSNQATAAIPTP